MAEQLVPIMKVTDADRAVEWYGRLGFAKEFEHRFSADFPAYVGITSEGAAIHLSEHMGDATPDTLLYYWVDDVDRIASDFGVSVQDAPWAREIELTDPDGNRIRIGTRKSDAPPSSTEASIGESADAGDDAGESGGDESGADDGGGDGESAGTPVDSATSSD